MLDAKQGEAVKILPEESQLTELLEMHSFLGLLNTMKIWLPAFSRHTSLMRSLARKDVVFRWGDDLQNKFNQVKQDISSVLEIDPYDPSKPVVIYSDTSIVGVLVS